VGRLQKDRRILWEARERIFYYLEGSFGAIIFNEACDFDHWMKLDFEKA